MEQDMEQMGNATHPDLSAQEPATIHPVYHVLAFVVLTSLVACLVAMALYFRRRARLSQLRDRLLPLYTYDPAEQEEDWGDEGTDEEEQLEESLLKKRQLAFTNEN